MSFAIAVAGKGGVGKTTTAALLVRALLRAGRRPVLAVDADSNSTFGDALGLEIWKTIGGMREEFSGEKASIPAGMTKESYWELKINEVLVEGKGLDLLSMGRPEGPGCYCFANNVLRHVIQKLTGGYPFVVIDNEAGMEHMSRRTATNVDLLVLVSDHSIQGIRAAGRINALADELGLPVRERALVLNRAPETIGDSVSEEMERAGLSASVFVPADGEVVASDLARKSLLELPSTNPAARVIEGWVQERVLASLARPLPGALGIPDKTMGAGLGAAK